MPLALTRFSFPARGQELLRSLDGSPAVYYADFDGAATDATEVLDESLRGRNVILYMEQGGYCGTSH